MARYVPTKRCSKIDKHEPHDWKEGAFPRACPGRTAPKAPSRSRRPGHPRNNPK